jgi:hypothetical protein
MRTWETQSEFTTRTDSTTPNMSGPNTVTTNQATGSSISSVISSMTQNIWSEDSLENPRSSLEKGDQITFKVPYTKITKDRPAYDMGSSSILSVKPASALNTTGGFIDTSKDSKYVPSSINKNLESFSNPTNVASLADSISGRESQGLDVKNVINYYFTPGSPGEKLFKGLRSSDFLTAALQIHPKLSNGSFDPKYVQYCNALGSPVTDNPGSSNNGK